MKYEPLFTPGFVIRMPAGALLGTATNCRVTNCGFTEDGLTKCVLSEMALGSLASWSRRLAGSYEKLTR